MFNGLCHTGTWGSLGKMGVSGWVGLILNLVFWVGLFALRDYHIVIYNE